EALGRPDPGMAERLSLFRSLIVKITPNDGKGFTEVFPNLATGTSVKWTRGPDRRWAPRSTRSSRASTPSR
ncbi:hypothetical protein, partial [Nocardioides sp.]|uniref:hypothetical protein n=1 Tax=Nocardioides sp. TaxID=35761 RepID=UPI0039E5E653